MVIMACSLIPIARAEGIAPEINAETESSSQNVYLLGRAGMGSWMCTHGSGTGR